MRRIGATNVPPSRMMMISQSSRQEKENDLFKDADMPEIKRPIGVLPVAQRPQAQAPPEEEQRPRSNLIAYVAHRPACKYSEEFIALSEELGVELNVFDVQQNGLPNFRLPGVPTLETANKELYCGDAAFDYLVVIAKQQQSERKPKSRQGSFNGSQRQHPSMSADDVDLPRANVKLGGKKHAGPPDLNAVEETAQHPVAQQPLQAAGGIQGTQTNEPGMMGTSLNAAFSEGDKLEQMLNSANNGPVLSAQQLFDQQMAARG